MMLIAALASSMALTACGGGEKNSSTSANNSSSASGAGAGASAGGGKADAFRQTLIGQCEQGLQSHPSKPPGFDTAGTCRCAVETALGNQADPVTYARSPEGQNAIGQAIISCTQRAAGSLKK